MQISHGKYTFRLDAVEAEEAGRVAVQVTFPQNLAFAASQQLSNALMSQARRSSLQNVATRSVSRSEESGTPTTTILFRGEDDAAALDAVAVLLSRACDENLGASLK